MKAELIAKVGTKIKDLAGMTGLKFQAASPDICLGFGIALIGIGVVEACAATLKAEEVIEPNIMDIEDIKADYEAEVLTKKEYHKELSQVYGQLIKGLVKTYGRAAIALIIGILLICKGQGILKKRNLIAVGLYNALVEDYEAFYDSVKDEYGEEVANRLKNGLKQEDIELQYTDEDGKDHKKKVKNALIADPHRPSPYSRFFAKGYSDCWSPSNDYNITFIRTQENIANDKLNIRGYITLAEVYELLGFEATEASLAVGWVVGNGENEVKFGLQEVYIAPDNVPVYDEAKVRFTNGYEPAILLDFNVDGVILDKLSEIGLAKI